MTISAFVPSPPHQAVIHRFVAACQADARVIAAFLGGSYARGAADAYSDLDLYLITSDEGYAGFFAEREAFIHQLGTPIFLKDTSDYGFDLLLYVLADGTDGELGMGRASHFTHIHSGPYTTLLDKQGILAGAVFPLVTLTEAEQVENLRDQMAWFWHDLAHFITALSRHQLWAAAGALEDLRRPCVNLARLRHNFAAPTAGYEKLEQALPIAELSPIQASFSPLEPEALLQAAVLTVRFYRDLAPPLAESYGLPYSTDLAALMTARLAKLCQVYGVAAP